MESPPTVTLCRDSREPVAVTAGSPFCFPPYCISRVSSTLHPGGAQRTSSPGCSHGDGLPAAPQSHTCRLLVIRGTRRATAVWRLLDLLFVPSPHSSRNVGAQDRQTEGKPKGPRQPPSGAAVSCPALLHSGWGVLSFRAFPGAAAPWQSGRLPCVKPWVQSPAPQKRVLYLLQTKRLTYLFREKMPIMRFISLTNTLTQRGDGYRYREDAKRLE